MVTSCNDIAYNFSLTFPPTVVVKKKPKKQTNRNGQRYAPDMCLPQTAPFQLVLANTGK